MLFQLCKPLIHFKSGHQIKTIPHFFIPAILFLIDFLKFSIHLGEFIITASYQVYFIPVNSPVTFITIDILDDSLQIFIFQEKYRFCSNLKKFLHLLLFRFHISLLLYKLHFFTFFFNYYFIFLLIILYTFFFFFTNFFFCTLFDYNYCRFCFQYPINLNPNISLRYQFQTVHSHLHHNHNLISSRYFHYYWSNHALIAYFFISLFKKNSLPGIFS